MAHDEGRHWVVRIAGGVLICLVAFLSLSIWDTWELSPLWRLLVGGVLAGLFLIFGGNLRRWVREIGFWS